MTLSEALFAHIAALADVVSTAGTNVFSVEGLRPTTTYQDAVVIAFEGASIDSLNSTNTVRIADFSVVVVSTVHLRAVSLAESIVRSLHGYSGVMGGAGGVNVIDCTAKEGPEEHDTETNLFARVVTLSVTYEF